MGKVPVYLRRAAINKASATVKSTQELQSGFPEKLEAKVTFFKGMFRPHRQIHLPEAVER